VWGVINRVSNCQLVNKGIAQWSMIGIVVSVTVIDAVSKVMSIHACNETDLIDYSSPVDCWQSWACEQCTTTYNTYQLLRIHTVAS
jgi:hypothetical protein